MLVWKLHYLRINVFAHPATDRIEGPAGKVPPFFDEMLSLWLSGNLHRLSVWVSVWAVSWSEGVGAATVRCHGSGSASGPGLLEQLCFSSN